MTISSSTKYIDTGISWIGTIPSDWQMVSLKSIARVILGKMRQDKPASKEDTLEKYLCAKDVHLDGINWYEPKEMYFSPKEKRALLVKDGDLLIVEGGAGAGGAYVAKNPTSENFYVQNSINIVRAHKCVLPQYLYYWVNKLVTNGYVEVACNVATIPHFTKEKVSSIQIPLPSLDVQQRIVSYLDSHVISIDKRMSLLATKRDLYKRLKTAIINRVVTRGLNPDVKLKDSGVEWIGMIPEHWEVKRVKDVASINRASLSEDTSYSYQFKYIDISNVSSEGNISFGESIAFYGAPSRARRILKKGDTIVSTVRTYLRAIAYIDFDANDVIASTGFAVLSPTKDVEPKYMAYTLRDCSIVDSICNQSTGVSYPAIAASKLAAIGIVLPPFNEQQSIALYLDEKCGKIDTAIANIDKQTDALKRLKRSLINEVITGQRAV